MEYVRVRCGQCNAVYKVKSQLAGRKVKCSSCQQILIVPAQAPPEGPAEKLTPTRAQAEAAETKSNSPYGLEAPDAPPPRAERKTAHGQAEEEETSAARPGRKARSSQRARRVAWKKVRLGLLFLATATTITLTTWLASWASGYVLPARAALVLYQLMYPSLLVSQALQIGGFSFVLFVPARIPKHLTAGVLATCLVISILGEAMTLWAWISLGSEKKSQQQTMSRIEQATQKLQDANPAERAKARELLEQVGREVREDLAETTRRARSYFSWGMLLWPLLLISLAVNWLLFPFWLKALARILHVESLVDAYMDLYFFATALLVVGLVCSVLVFWGVPYWVLMFVIMPLGLISSLLSVGIQYAYLKLLIGFRDATAERI